MKALLITQENLEKVKENYPFEVHAIEAEDPEKGKYIIGYEDDAADIVGKYLVDDWPHNGANWAVVSAGVFDFAFDRGADIDGEWFEVLHGGD